MTAERLSKLTVADVDDFLRCLGAEPLANALREAKTADGRYRFAPDDPVSGPFSGDLADVAWTDAVNRARIQDGQLR